MAASDQKLTSLYECPDGTEFPVEWDDPSEGAFGWRWDQMHCPLPLTPLSQEIGPMLLDGFGRTFDVTGMPVYMEQMHAHGYAFMRLALFDDDPEVRTAVRNRDMEARTDRILELWKTEYQPEVEALTRSLWALDEPSLTLAQLVDRLDQVRMIRRRHGELHALVMNPASFAGNRFFEFCTKEFGDRAEMLDAELNQGFPNKSLESANALWELTQEAKQRPEVEKLLRDQPTPEFLASVEAVQGGGEFLSLLDSFLDEYGYRNESFSEFLFPTWREEPVFPIFIVRSYLDVEDDSSPEALHERSAKRREERVKECEVKLSGEPEKLATFRAWLTSAQQRTVLLEDHNFYIDQQGHSAVRVPLLAIGRHLAAQGTISAPDDVFYLHQAEIEEAATNSGRDFRPQVEERRAGRERWMRVLPPASIGASNDVMNPLWGRFFGGDVAEPSDPSEITGLAGSAGVVRGTARFIPTLSEVERLSAGEILVTYATAPPWTPLFAVAGGIVTDVGGALSHCAVVAREYGIPAVVGTKVATQRIKDGMLITVDGTNGVVRIED